LPVCQSTPALGLGSAPLTAASFPTRVWVGSITAALATSVMIRSEADTSPVGGILARRWPAGQDTPPEQARSAPRSQVDTATEFAQGLDRLLPPGALAVQEQPQVPATPIATLERALEQERAQEQAASTVVTRAHVADQVTRTAPLGQQDTAARPARPVPDPEAVGMPALRAQGRGTAGPVAHRVLAPQAAVGTRARPVSLAPQEAPGAAQG